MAVPHTSSYLPSLPAIVRPRIALAVLVAVHLFGCGDAEGPSGPGPAVTLTPSDYTFTALGDTARFNAVMRDASGDTVEVASFRWSSSNEDVATVDSVGLVTAVGPGSATIAAEANGIRGDARLAVEVSPAVSAGWTHSCGITIGRDAYCWGDNESGQLGDGTTTARHTPVPVVGGLDFTELSAGRHHTCGVTTGGGAYCWGGNSHGQLGDDTHTDRTTPVPVVGGLEFTTVSAGAGHTCGVATGGRAYCWGRNIIGQLGVGSTSECLVPVQVLRGLSFAAVSAGVGHTCGTADGNAYCWADNSHGQLGDGTTTDRTTPARVVW